MSTCSTCRDCGATTMWVRDDRGNGVQLDVAGVPAVVLLSFLPRRPDRIRGFSRAGDRIAGLPPTPEQPATGRIYMEHRRCRGGRRG